MGGEDGFALTARHHQLAKVFGKAEKSAFRTERGNRA